MENGKTMLEHLTTFLNKGMILYMKNDITYKGIYRGIGKKKKLVFDLTEKVTMVGVENCVAKYETKVLHSTEYINPEDLLNFEVDKSSTSKNVPINYGHAQLYLHSAPPTSSSTEPNAEVSRASQDEVQNVPVANAEHPPAPIPVPLDPTIPPVLPGSYLSPSWSYATVNWNGQIVFLPPIIRRTPYILYYPPVPGVPLKPGFYVYIRPIPVEIPNVVHQQSELPIQVHNEPCNSLNHENLVHLNNIAPDMLEQQSSLEQPIDLNNRALSSVDIPLYSDQPIQSNQALVSLNYQFYSEQRVEMNGQALHDHSYDSRESYSQISHFYNHEARENFLNNQQLPEMPSQSGYEHQLNYHYERSSNLFNQEPCNLLNQATNNNYCQELDVTTSTILHSYSITQLMAGVVPGVDNFLQEQTEVELQLEPSVGVFPVNEPKQKSSITEDQNSVENVINPLKITNEQINAFSYYIPIECIQGVVGNTRDKTQVLNEITEVIESDPGPGPCNADYVSVPFGLIDEDNINNIQGSSGTGDLTVKYTVVKRKKHKPILPKTSTSRADVPSISPEETDMDKMSSEEFELFLTKALGEELMSLINMS